MQKSFPILAVLVFLIFTNRMYSLENFDYTGIAFNGSGTIISSQTTVAVNIQLINNNGIQYQENHTNVKTDQFGAYTITIGSGSKIGTNNLIDINATKDLKIKSTVTYNGSSGVWVVSSLLKPTVAVTKASSNSGSTSGSYWNLTGNSGITPGTHFIGTTDGKPTELKVEFNGNKMNSLVINLSHALYRNAVFTDMADVITDGGVRGWCSTDLQIYRTAASSIASGSSSTLCGGMDNKASAYASTICGGENNISSGNTSTIGGGFWNRANAEYSTVGGGNDNKASGSYATVSGGFSAVADKYGQFAYASGAFSFTSGSAQTSVFVTRNTTSNAGWTNLFLDGSGENISLPSSATWSFRIIVVGKQSGGTTNGAGYEIKGLVTNNNGTATFIGTPSVTILGESNTAYDARVTVSNSNLIVQVLGAGDALRWVARIETAEVTW